MNSQRVIEAAIRAAQDSLWQNAPPMHYVADDVTVARLRELVRSPAIQAALLRSSNTFLTFVLRAVEIVVSDQSQDDGEIIGRLWDVLDAEPGAGHPAELPHLVRALPPPTLRVQRCRHGDASAIKHAIRIVGSRVTNRTDRDRFR